MAPDPVTGGGRPAGGDARSPLEVLKRGRRWPRRLLISTNVFVLVVLLAGASAYGYVQWRLSQVKRINVAGLAAAKAGPITILMVGSDTRNLGSGGSASFGNAQQVTGQRSDTIVLAHIVPATSSIALLSIPRDLLVDIPGMGTTRINAAFNSGPALLVKTIEQDIGIPVNHFAVVNFASFTKLSDAIGGVYQYFPTPARDLFSNLNVPNAGCVLLKGAQALGFVRSREYQYFLNGTWNYQLVPESDLARIQRQQAFIKLAIKKAEHSALSNPLTLNSVLSGITSSITVDSSFSNSLMINLALAMRHTNAAGIPNWTYPNVNSASVPGALDPVPSADHQMVHQFLTYGLPSGATTATTGAPAAAHATKATQVVVEVLNGSGLSGQAAQAANALKAAGLQIGSTGNAANFNYVRSVIEYGPSGASAARSLAARVGGGAALQEVPSLAGGNLVLVTGQDYTGISKAQASTAAAPPAPSTTVASPSTTAHVVTATSSPTSSPGGLTVPPSGVDSSSYYHGQYVPPGLQPGQVPRTCPS
jgi:LCP family protein required for cell wall assembly